MGDVELVLLIGGAWCAVLALLVALLTVARRADDRTDALLARTEPTPSCRPRFTERTPERELPGRAPARDRAPGTRA
jgi:hypothetical protein